MVQFGQIAGWLFGVYYVFIYFRVRMTTESPVFTKWNQVFVYFKL